MRALADGGLWRGEAADAFRHRLEDLPRDLDRAAEAYGLASRALTRFGLSLLEAQTAARGLEDRAASADDSKWATASRKSSSSMEAMSWLTPRRTRMRCTAMSDTDPVRV